MSRDPSNKPPHWPRQVERDTALQEKPRHGGSFSLQLSRWNALLGQCQLTDPFSQKPRLPFSIDSSDFLRIAIRNPPTTPEPTVSAFADWIYSLYRRRPDPAALRFGREYESLIFDQRPDFWIDSLIAESPHSSNWKLVHNGLTVRGIDDQRTQVYTIPGLCINGQSLRASPDLIYRCQRTGRAFVVEIKFTRSAIPTNLWPNVWAQLWAYSKIPTLEDATELGVVGEVWGEAQDWVDSPSKDPLQLRAVVQNNPRRPAFDSYFAELFGIYSAPSARGPA
jgi:hypothetical protein